MRQEDYILREIAKIGDFLLALMGKFEQKKPHAEINNEFLEFTGIDIDKILATPGAKLPDLLDYKKGYNHENIERLGDFLSELPGDHAKLKALELYQLATEMDRSYSITREVKVAQLRQELNLP